ncbi:aryl-alcohol dehydrogenase-like predicted oxidoreductase [Frondihabitans sp. PhB188]|uniref:aldo/keto reductase n=1 Tax=Frondihabitans sp. PhB188 TaxID=2485200 RepID=UPI000F4A5315|nr:aldo/keto reductase [Frondihabitans sp. PhB188]ROQ36586.1 aryl-alcohol dehydrogenase-like predicted oxidoreductase [Frondihabitans sp. PhB188]
MTSPTTARWAVLGAGSIARRFVSQLPSSGGVLAAVGSTDEGRAAGLAAFAVEHGAGPGGSDGPDGSGGDAVRTGTYAEILADPSIDAVYVATVHTGHARLVLDAIAAGKAVLCEKPLTPNAGTTMVVADEARQAGATLVEAYMYRFHPQTRALLDLVREGAIGELVHIDAAFSFAVAVREGRLFDVETAGGGILDVGGYPVSMARAVVGAARGRAFAEPLAVTAKGALGPTGVDEWTVAQLEFGDGVTATVRCGVRVDDANAVTITGSLGSIVLTDPWTLGEQPEMTVRTVDGETRSLSFSGAQPYGLEAAATIAALRDGSGETLESGLDDSVGTARVLDQWREAISLRYPFEREDVSIPPVTGAPLAVSPDAPMVYGEIDGVGKRVSRLIMGVDNQENLAHASAIFDHFVSQGGNTFDTGWLYGHGEMEERLGRWIANRGIREDLVVITKGAHTPYCDPESLSRQLLESLERQGTGYADIYMMHRDNTEVPVGEFVDVLDEHRAAGRIHVYGGSNWTPARVDEANAYARANGRAEFSVLSNHFGLAEAYDVPWAGCKHVTDPESKRWLEERQIPLLPWSSQARGFFTGRARPDDLTDAELVRCYYSDDNFERLRRAEQLGAEHGVAATAIALAFVLHQPFPTFPLFGPRTIAEARSSMRGLGVELTPEQVAWLDLR